MAFSIVKEKLEKLQQRLPINFLIPTSKVGVSIGFVSLMSYRTNYSTANHPQFTAQHLKLIQLLSSCLAPGFSEDRRVFFMYLTYS
jgi:hypothetical protein